MSDPSWRIQHQSNEDPHRELTQLRGAIDALDKTIAALLAQRLSLCAQIGEVKAAAGIAVKDTKREDAVMSNVRSVTTDAQTADSLTKIYSTVIAESCRKQSSDPVPSSPKVSYFPRVLVVGLGMIGGALARRIKKVKPTTEISAVDSAAVLESALSQGVIDKSEGDLARAVSRAGLILLCATPAENLRILQQIAPLTKRRQIIVDVTSTKNEICQLAEDLPLKAEFIGGHPLFGSHKAGFDAARDVEVDGKRFCLVPTSRSGDLTVRRLSRWLSELGMQVVTMDATTHDGALARTSHNVQLLCTALGASLARGRNEQQLRSLVQLSGPSFSSMSRLMASPADMWLEIIKQNRSEICESLTELIDELRSTRTDISLENDSSLRERFEQARRIPNAMTSSEKPPAHLS